MDQAEKLRNVIKLKNQKLPQKARVITVTSGKVAWENPALQLIWQSSFRK